jgi:TRAP-type C4-dicarboxylate transport system substrate-binding protein
MQINNSRYSSLSDAIDSLKQGIDEAAGKARLRYITSVPGQEAVYLEKMNQAKAYVAEIIEPTDMTGYEYIEAEATATGMTRQAVAERINAVSVLWNTVISP